MSDGYEREIKQYKDFPYCVIGSPHIPESIGCFLRGDALKKIVEQMREGEDLRITFFAGNKATKFEIIDTHKKYPKQKEKK
jgi:hypothetical protein